MEPNTQWQIFDQSGLIAFGNAPSDNVTVLLPESKQIPGQTLFVKNLGPGRVTIGGANNKKFPSGFPLIDGSGLYIILPEHTVLFCFDGKDWYSTVSTDANNEWTNVGKLEKKVCFCLDEGHGYCMECQNGLSYNPGYDKKGNFVGAVDPTWKAPADPNGFTPTVEEIEEAYNKASGIKPAPFQVGAGPTPIWVPIPAPPGEPNLFEEREI